MGKVQNIIHLDETQKGFILTNLDEDGRLSCLTAFKVAKLINLKNIQMSDACKSIDIKITDCELGVFGKINFKEAESVIYNKIAQNFTQDTKMTCKTLWKQAETTTLRRVGSTVKNSDIEVTYCQLGCFRQRKGNHGSKS